MNVLLENDAKLEQCRQRLAAKGRTLTRLDLSDCYLTATDLESLLPLLNELSCPKLQQVKLANNPLSNDMGLIAKMLMKNRSINDLDISNIGASQASCEEFCNALKDDIVRLGRIVLSKNPIFNHGLESVIKSINFYCDPDKEFPTIECDQCNLSDDAFYALDSVLDRYDHVRVIFTGNHFSDQGMSQLSHALWTHQHIVYLDLRNNLYSESSMLRILQMLLSSRLKLFTINNMKFSFPVPRNKDHCIAVNEIPFYNLRLFSLSITPELITILAQTQILHKRKSNWEFGRLSFEKCQFSNSAIQTLSLLVQKKSVLTLSFIECVFPENDEWIQTLFSKIFACTRELILDLCKINDQQLMILSSQIKNVTDLRTVSLRSNNLTPRSMKKLEQWLGNDRKCEELILSGNDFENHQFAESLTLPKKPTPQHTRTADPTESPPSELETAQNEVVLFSPRHLNRRASSPRPLQFLSPRKRSSVRLKLFEEDESVFPGIK